MRGDNPIRRAISGTGQELEIKEIYRSIQGEGPNSGQPAIFVRLGGCNLACDFCDTEFENFFSMGISQILDKIEILNKPKSIDLIVITGGEPLRQPIKNLCDALLEKGFRVQIETNGTLFRDLDSRVEIVCSPKNNGNGYFPLRDDLLQKVQALKFLISANHPLYQEIPDVGQGRYNIPVYVQPMDEFDEEKNLSNQKLAAAIAGERGYRLSMQLHKIAGIR